MSSLPRIRPKTASGEYKQVKRPPNGKVFVESSALLESLMVSEVASYNNNNPSTADGGDGLLFLPAANKSTHSSGQENRPSTAPQISNNNNSSSRSSSNDEGKPGSKTRFLKDKIARQAYEAEQEQLRVAAAIASKKKAAEKKLLTLNSKIKASMSFLEVVDQELDLLDEAKRLKTRRVFEDWNTNVHGSIVKNIAKQIDSMDPKQLHKQKLADYGKFLHVSNIKPSIFRDIIIETEYDPLEVNRRAIKAKVPLLKDPLNIDKQKSDAEEALVEPSKRKVERRGGKDTLDVKLWAKEKIVGTPYGIFAKLMEDSSKKSIDDDHDSENNAKAAAAPRPLSNVHFDHFSFPTGSAGIVAVNKELPRGKSQGRKVYADPSKIFPYAPQVREELLKIAPLPR